MKHFLCLLAVIFYLTGCGSSESDNGSTNGMNDKNSSLPVEDENLTLPATDANESIVVVIPPQSEQNSTCESKYSTEILEGRELYIRHCQVCHASDAKSGNYDIRGSVKADIDNAMISVPDMVSLDLASQVSDENRELIALFLQQIWVDPDVEFGDNCAGVQKITKEGLGNKLFFDANLSLQRSMSCSTCHNPQHGFIDARFYDPSHNNPTSGALSLGDDGVSLGGRNAPTISYAMFTPTFTKTTTGNYLGGQFHDGRAATLQDQAKGPFLDSAEMMMPSAQAVIDRVLENTDYVTEFKALYGEEIFNDTQTAFSALAESIAKFEKTYVFAPFDSKYDRSKLEKNDPNYYEFNNLEKAGYELFFDANKTRCVTCHSINAKSESQNELFTNFQYENIGTPKNMVALQARDSHTSKIDLQLGGRVDINESAHYGKTKVPTLRNIAITAPYMSNGVFKQLRTVLEFYNHMSGQDTTDVNPETMQAWGEAEISETINHEKLRMSLLTQNEIDALEAFLKTLTDKRYETLIK